MLASFLGFVLVSCCKDPALFPVVHVVIARCFVLTGALSFIAPYEFCLFWQSSVDCLVYFSGSCPSCLGGTFTDGVAMCR